MHIIICLDDKNGIRFNGRRQSRDRVLCDRILAMTKDTPLWMNEYSAKIFTSDKIKVANRFLAMSAAGDYCFVENDDFLQYMPSVQRIIIYRWNRVYPSDVKIDPSVMDGRTLVARCDFEGSSHERITEEIYE